MAGRRVRSPGDEAWPDRGAHVHTKLPHVHVHENTCAYIARYLI